MKKFRRKSREELEKIFLERLRETKVQLLTETKILLEVAKGEREKKVNKEAEVEIVRSIRQHEANLIAHELDLQMVEDKLKEYDKVEIIYDTE